MVVGGYYCGLSLVSGCAYCAGFVGFAGWLGFSSFCALVWYSFCCFWVDWWVLLTRFGGSVFGFECFVWAYVGTLFCLQAGLRGVLGVSGCWVLGFGFWLFLLLRGVGRGVCGFSGFSGGRGWCDAVSVAF